MAEQDATSPVTTERKQVVPAEIPVLPLRDTVLFPNSFMPLAVARDSSVALIDSAISGVEGVKTVSSTSSEGLSVVQADLAGVAARHAGLRQFLSVRREP